MFNFEILRNIVNENLTRSWVELFDSSTFIEVRVYVNILFFYSCLKKTYLSVSSKHWLYIYILCVRLWSQVMILRFKGSWHRKKFNLVVVEAFIALIHKLDMYVNVMCAYFWLVAGTGVHVRGTNLD